MEVRRELSIALLLASPWSCVPAAGVDDKPSGDHSGAAPVDTSGDSDAYTGDTTSSDDSGRDSGPGGDSAPDTGGTEPFSAACLEGLEEGYFRSSTGGGPGDPVLVDVDGDGDLDLVVPSTTGVDTWLGAGDGEFRHAGTLPAYASAAALADFDGDGRADLAYLDGGGDVVAHAGDGAGSFDAAGVTTATGCATADLATADLDGDGLRELVSSCDDEALLVLSQAGALAFSVTRHVLDGSATKLVAVDLDGDGLDEVAVVVGGDRVAVLGKEGDGSLTPLTSVSTGTVTGLAPGDLDGDGDTDLVAAASTRTELAWLVNDGAGALTLVAVPGPENPWSWGLADVAVADVDGDGLDDAVGTGPYSDPFGNLVHVFGGGTAGPSYLLGSNPNLEDWLGDVAAGDIDGDGLGDIVVLGDDVVYAHRAIGAGAFDDDTWLGGAGETGGDFALVDLDGDGLDDLLGIEAWFLSAGGGEFGDARPTGVVGFDVVAADLDGDGDRDGVVADGTTVSVLRNEGGLVQAVEEVDVRAQGLYYAYAVAVADLDGDGDTDLVASSQNVYGLAAWLNDGAGHFTFSAAVDPGLRGVLEVALADVTGDGKVDAVLVATTEAAVQVWAGDGAGEFAPAWSDATPAWTRSLDTADIDGDGDTDFVVGAGDGDDEPAWVLAYENDGGSYTRHEFPVTALSRVALADWSGDGWIDLALATLAGDGLAMWAGDGAFGFVDLGPIPDAVGVRIGVFAPGDANGDGRQDLAVYTADGTFVLGNGCE